MEDRSDFHNLIAFICICNSSLIWCHFWKKFKNGRGSEREEKTF
jgi:hypothetical protein